MLRPVLELPGNVSEVFEHFFCGAIGILVLHLKWFFYKAFNKNYIFSSLMKSY